MIAIIYDPDGESLRGDDPVFIEKETVVDILKQIASDEKLLGTLDNKVIEFFQSRDYLEQDIYCSYDSISRVAAGLAASVREKGVNPDITLTSCNTLGPMLYRADQMITGLNQKLNEEKGEDAPQVKDLAEKKVQQ